MKWRVDLGYLKFEFDDLDDLRAFVDNIITHFVPEKDRHFMIEIIPMLQEDRE